MCSPARRGSPSAFSSGGLIGSQAGTPSDSESEPQELAERLRATIPRGSSAIVLIAEGAEIDELLQALGDGTEPQLREPLSEAQAAALEASLRSARRAPTPLSAGAVQSRYVEITDLRFPPIRLWSGSLGGSQALT